VPIAIAVMKRSGMRVLAALRRGTLDAARVETAEALAGAGISPRKMDPEARQNKKSNGSRFIEPRAEIPAETKRRGKR